MEDPPLRSLRLLAATTAALLATGEVARRVATGQFPGGLVPAGLDDLAVSALLFWAAWRAGRDGAAPLLAAWSGFSGYVLVLLTLNAVEMAAGLPGKVGYAAALLLLLLLGLWSATRAYGRLTAAR